MRYRIGAWAGAGFLVASFWAIYLFPTTPTGSTAMLHLARLTCPIAFIGFGVYFYWVLLANAATYALVGLIVETMRHPKPSAQL